MIIKLKLGTELRFSSSSGNIICFFVNIIYFLIDVLTSSGNIICFLVFSKNQLMILMLMPMVVVSVFFFFFRQHDLLLCLPEEPENDNDADAGDRSVNGFSSSSDNIICFFIDVLTSLGNIICFLVFSKNQKMIMMLMAVICHVVSILIVVSMFFLLQAISFAS